MAKTSYKLIGNEDRERIVNAYVNGSNATSISKFFGFNVRTVQNIVKKYIDGEDYRRKPKLSEKEAPKVIMPESQRKLIQSCVEKDCNISLKEIKERLMNEMEVTVSERIISMNLNAFNYSFKRIDRSLQSNDLTTLEFRAFYANTFFNEIMEFIDSKVIFINEATFNVSTRLRESSTGRRKAEKQGFRARIINTSMCCAMSINGLVEYQSQLRRFFTDTFNQFVKSVIEKLEKTNIPEAIIIIDNAYIEKDPSIKDLIESKGHKLIHSPPNSSFLNPVEGIYTKWIQLIRAKEIKNEKELFKVIDNILSEISSNDCRYFFEQMLSFLPRCLNREEILE